MELRNYQKKLEELLNKYKTIDDIIVFGSIVKGSSEPNDMDIALLLKEESEVREIKEAIRVISKNVDIEIVASVYNPLWIVLIREGFSIRKKKFLFEIYKIEPVVLYKYSLKKLSLVQKVQFTRGFKHILKDTKAKILSRSIVLVPLNKRMEFDEFLSNWDLVYETQNYELFPILRKGELI